MNISNHARKRMKERCGFNKNAGERMARKAFKEGITHAQTKGNLNKWVTSLFFKTKKADNIRLYGDHAYIFCGEVLVTVIAIPASLRRDLKSMLRQGSRQERK